ncbi:CBM_collapsed_G0046730.mRNA.1.CDS.1 [Saccharomyces cerevisiae]|nr:CBM_collapsed_G0046730.mRNA.1.CDS.1 [Saccharomyces cerevisiae]
MHFGLMSHLLTEKSSKKVFNDFLNAGAEILMTTTHTKRVIKSDCRFSRNCIGEDKYLIGCIGPWGAHICRAFTGDYGAEPENIDFTNTSSPQLENFDKMTNWI